MHFNLVKPHLTCKVYLFLLKMKYFYTEEYKVFINANILSTKQINTIFSINLTNIERKYSFFGNLSTVKIAKSKNYVELHQIYRKFQNNFSYIYQKHI
jgi:hypothetical protein